MTDYDLKINRTKLLDLLSRDDAMAELVSTVLNQVLEAEMKDHLGAEHHERSDTRTGYRNGYRTRTLTTRVGPLILHVPQTRDGEFSTALFRRYQRSEQAFVLGLMEMYVQGVSTRKVSAITEELCGVSFSKSTVSGLCQELDQRLNTWRCRSLENKRYPFILIDALVIDVRRDEAICSTAALIAYGINEKGQRETLDIQISDSESEHSWDCFFKQLKDRGLCNVDLVTSDAHTGLVKALKRNFQGAQWQRCQVHFMRNVLGHTKRTLRQEVADQLKLVFTATNKETARKLASNIVEQYQEKAPKAMEVLDDGLEQALTILQFPKRYRKRLRTTNLPERVNEEIRRRQRVIRIFPNEAAAMRLISALLAEINDQWLSASHAYLDMNEYWDWKKEKQNSKSKTTTNNVVTMN